MPEIKPEWAALVVLVGAGFLISVIGSLVSIYKGLRREPPIDKTLLDYVRKDELNQVIGQVNAGLVSVEERTRSEIVEFKGRYEKNMGEVFNTLRSTTQAFESGFRDLSHAIGKLEGKIETHLTEERKPK